MLTKKSDFCSLRGYWPIRSKKYREQKDYKIKKTRNFFTTNQNSNKDGSRGQFGQVLEKPKKDSCLHYKPQSQSSNILATGVNATTIKNNKKVEINLRQIKYYNYYKKVYYANKYLDK